MKHYLLLRFPTGFLTAPILSRTKAIFSHLAHEITGIKSIHISRNCVFRESNMDLMIEMELQSPEILHTYLAHRLHQQFIIEIGVHALERCTFDQSKEEEEVL